MNPSTILGMLGGIAVVIVSIWATTEDALLFVNVPGLLIVVGGTLAATLVAFPPGLVLRVFRNFVVALKRENTYDRDDVDEIARIARLWSKGQLHEVEKALENVNSPFLKTGIQLIIDGSPLNDILELLHYRIARLKAREEAEANVFFTMGSYAPAFGMVGTLIGLLNMLANMSGESFDRLGLNMAVALVTTFYGILLANLVLKPIGNKLEERTAQRVRVLSMVTEAVSLISRRRSPAYIRETLYSFLAEFDDEVGTVRGIVPADEPAPAAAAGPDVSNR